MKNTGWTAWFPVVLANTVPVIGVVFRGWDGTQVLLAYWMETAVIGLFALPRMFMRNSVASVVVFPFYLLVYAGFMAFHYTLIVELFENRSLSLEMLPAHVRGPLLTPWGLGTVIGFLAGHGLSFVQEISGERAREIQTFEEAAAYPVYRIMAMQAILLLGGVAVKVFHTRIPLLLLLIGLKSLIDLKFGEREGKKRSSTAG